MPRSDYIFCIDNSCDMNARFGPAPGLIGSKDTKMCPLEQQRQLKRSSSCRVVSVVEKTTDLLDLVADLGPAKDTGSRLSTSQSCLALNEISKIKDVGSNYKPTSSRDVCYSKRSMLIRKDSGTESGFVEAETESECEASRQIPDSFDLLPPLERRRQVRIRELVLLAENLANGFSCSLQKLESAVRSTFPNTIAISLARKIDALEKIESVLFTLARDLSKKKLKFTHRLTSKGDDEFYVDAVGNLFSSKIKDVLVKHNELQEIGSGADMKGSQSNEIHLLHGDTLGVLSEYFLRLQLALKYVLYCTPRQHIDHRPLTSIVEDLNRLNRRKFHKEPNITGAKEQEDCLSSSDKEETTASESKCNENALERKTKLMVKRRHSCDNSTLKKLSSLTRGIGFLRNSGRRSRQEGEVLLKKASSSESGRRAKQHKSESPLLFHSTPKEARSLHRECKQHGVLEDRVTSFDSNVNRLSGQRNTDYSYRNNESISFDNDSASSSIIASEASCLGKSGNVSKEDYQAIVVGGCTAGYKGLCLDRDLDCGTKRERFQGRMSSLGKTDSGITTEPHRERDRSSGSDGTRSQGKKPSQRASESTPSKCATLDASYEVSNTEDTPVQCLKVSPGSNRRDPHSLPLNPRCLTSSPTLLPDFSPPSPSLLECSINLFPSTCNSMSERRSSDGKQSSKLEERKATKDKESPGKLPVTVPSPPESCASDEDMRLDKFIGKSCSKIVPKVILHERSNRPIDESPCHVARYSANHGKKLKYSCSEEKRSARELEAHSKPRKVSLDAPLSSKKSKKLSLDPASGLEPIENNAKGVRVTISRAKKTFLDFTSPRISRKKEKVLKKHGDVPLYSSGEVTGSVGEKTHHGNNKGPNKCITFVREVDNGREKTLKENCRACEEGCTATNCRRSCCCCENSAKKGENAVTVERDNLGHPKPKPSDGSCHLNRRLLDDRITGEEEQVSFATDQRSRSSSVSSNLSISMDFNVTVARFLRSNRESATETVVGNSIFYQASPDKSSRPNDKETPSVPREIIQSPSESIESALAKGSNDHVRDPPLEVQHGGQTRERLPATRVASNSAIESNSQETSKLVKMRISKSDPVLKDLSTQSQLKNAHGTSRPKADALLHTQRVLEKLHKIPKARVSSWSESFDNLLSDKDGVKVFGHFLKSEFSEENLLFWLACQQFKSTRSSRIAKEAQKIYEMFVAVCAVHEVNLDHQTRSSIKDSVQAPSKTIFDSAQSKIRLLMAQDSYPRFIRSQTYQSLVESR